MGTRLSFIGDGSLRDIDITFPFIDPSHVKASVDSTSVSYTWLTSSRIRLDSAPASGAEILVYRDTPDDEALVDYTDGAVLTENDLNLSQQQILFRQQELSDAGDDSSATAIRVKRGEQGFVFPPVADRANKWGYFDSDGRLVGTALSPGLSPGGSIVVASRILLANLEIPSNGQNVWLAEGRRRGMFEWHEGDYSAQVASDPLQGLYVAPAFDTTGSSGAWERVWDHIHGKPEWFGAVTGDGAYDNRAAILACEAVCPSTVYESADYWFTGKLWLKTSYRSHRGPFNPDGYNSGHGTRFISTDTTDDVVLIRPEGELASTDDFLRNITFQNITTMHVGTRTLPAPGAEKSAVTGLRAEYLIDSQITDNYFNEPLIGFAYKGLVGCDTTRNRAFRSELFGGNDIFIGSLCTGPALGFGLVGNNASVYGSKWNATCAGAARSGLPADRRIGAWFDEAFTDQFPDHTETLGCGIRITGVGAGDTGASNSDFEIKHPKVDQYDGISYDISGIAKTGHVRIIEPYAGVPANAVYTIRVRDSGGAVTITGGDVYGTPGSNESIGVNIENSTGLVTVDGMALHEIGRPFSAVSSSNFEINLKIVNQLNVSPTYQAALYFIGATRFRVKAKVVGRPDSFPQGAFFAGSGNDKGYIDMTGIDPACIQGGATNKLVINGVNINAPGNVTPAGAAGTPGDGILVAGITS